MIALLFTLHTRRGDRKGNCCLFHTCRHVFGKPVKNNISGFLSLARGKGPLKNKTPFFSISPKISHILFFSSPSSVPFYLRRKPADQLVTLVVVVVVVVAVAVVGGITFIHGLSQRPCMVLKIKKQNSIFLSFFIFFYFKSSYMV